MRLRLLVVAAALVAVSGGSADARPLLCGCSSSAEIPSSLMPAWSPDGKRIAFIQNVHGNNDLYVMNVDGSHKRALTHDEAREQDPDWSPDGKNIVFTTGFSGATRINVIGVNGTGLRLIDGDDKPSEPEWSPDGSRIVYVNQDREDEQGQIAVMNADGSNRHLVLNDDEWHASPAWSPDGKQIAFEGGVDDAFIDVVNADGTARRRLTFTGRESEPAWAPDGAGDDIICGVGGADEIDGGSGNDIVDGGVGADVVVGGPGYDVLLGAAGDDLLDSRDSKRDEVDGGPGNDRARIDPGDWIRLLEHIL